MGIAVVECNHSEPANRLGDKVSAQSNTGNCSHFFSSAETLCRIQRPLLFIGSPQVDRLERSSRTSGVVSGHSWRLDSGDNRE